MSRPATALAAVALVLGVGGATSAPPSPFLPRPPFSGPRELVLFGHVTSLTRVAGRWRLRFDPALHLGGTTANRAAVADGAIPAGDSVPNDFYVRDPEHRLLDFWVAGSAPVTVVGRGPSALRVAVADLAQIVRGRNPRHLPLFEPRNPFWIVVATDTVRSLDQQYSP